MKTQQRLLLLLLLFFHFNVKAQNNERILVKAGTTIKQSVPPSILYEYPLYMQGTVFFKNGKSAGTFMNYNLFLDEMQFITAKGDTLSLSNEESIKFITINTDTFYFEHGYIKSVTGAANARLGIKQTLKIIDKQKVGGYGMTSSTEAIDSYNSFNDGTKYYNLTVMQDLILARKEQYFISNDSNAFLLPSKKNLLQLFPEQHQAIAKYFKEHNVGLNDKPALENLVLLLNN